MSDNNSSFLSFINLVKLLITRKTKWPCSNVRKISLGQNLSIKDETLLANKYEKLENISSFVPIHMASQGYWQIQDENNEYDT